MDVQTIELVLGKILTHFGNAFRKVGRADHHKKIESRHLRTVPCLVWGTSILIQRWREVSSIRGRLPQISKYYESPLRFWSRTKRIFFMQGSKTLEDLKKPISYIDMRGFRLYHTFLIIEAKHGDSLLTLEAFGEMLEFEEMFLQDGKIWNRMANGITDVYYKICPTWKPEDETDDRVSFFNGPKSAFNDASANEEPVQLNLSTTGI